MNEPQQTVIIAGATGFIGRPLVRRLVDLGFGVVVLTVDSPKAMAMFGNQVSVVHWNRQKGGDWNRRLEGAWAVINLAGAPLSVFPWDDARKREIVRSRVQVGEALALGLAGLAKPPRVFIQASAVGFYGHRPGEALDEYSQAGNGFLAETTQAWEDSTSIVEKAGIRRAIIRSGIVLHRDGGLLARMLPMFRWGLGSVLGGGRQHMPWIHMHDELGAILFLLRNEKAMGVFNLTAPQAVSNRDFTVALAHTLRRPTFFHVPEFLLRMKYGLAAEELLLCDQKVKPKMLQENGFIFRFPELKPALTDLLQKKKG